MSAKLAHLDKINAAREERAELLDQQREILEAAETDKRDLSRREAAEFDHLDAKAEDLASKIAKLEREAEGAQPQRQVLGGNGPSAAATSQALLGREQRLADHFRPPSSFEPHEVRDFSLGRFVRGMVTGNWDDAALERRALGEGTGSAGGFLTPEALSLTVLDRIRNAAQVIKAGARSVPMSSDTESIARLAAGVTPAWRNENAAVAESDPTFERVTFTARTLAVLTRISYELFSDMSQAGAETIEGELIKAVALELDRAALRGTGTAPEPRGVLNQTGVTLIANGANGTAFGYDQLVNLVSTVQAAGFDPNAVITNPRLLKSAALLKDTTNQPLVAPQLVTAVPILPSKQVPITLTTGTNTDTSEAYAGQWDQLLIGFRPALGISIDKAAGGYGVPINVKSSSERYIDTMQVGILVFLRADIQLAHPEAFAVSTGIRP